MRTPLATILHFFSLAVIFILGRYIVLEKISNFDNSLPLSTAANFAASMAEIRTGNSRMLFEIEQSASAYKNEFNVKHQNEALLIRAMADSLRAAIDSISRTPNNKSTLEVLQQVKQLREMAIKMVETNRTGRDTLPDFERLDKTMLQSLRNSKGWPPVFDQLILSQMLAEIACLERYLFQYCVIQTNTCDGFGSLLPIFNCKQVAPKVGETIEADVFLTPYAPKPLAFAYFLNGKRLPAFDGIAIFKEQFTSPGIYPLNFAIQAINPETDAIQTYSQTYHLNIGN
jgi:hypothetical protein